jgi:hypothetical protein
LRALSQEERFWQYSGKLWLCFKVGRYGAGGENNYWEGKVIGLLLFLVGFIAGMITVDAIHRNNGRWL